MTARSVINCAGIQGDRIEQMLLGEAQFEIRPRKGQFVVFDKAAARHLRTILLPVPTARTKGVVLTRTIFGNLLVGPTAEEQEDRERPAVTRPELEMLIAKAVELVPALAEAQVTAVYAGLRPASEEKHYRVHSLPEKGYYCAGGIRSTGLTAALGIARHVQALWSQSQRISGSRPAETPIDPLPNLAEHLTRDWQMPGHDGIVCHCEMVTGREIDAALASPLPPGDFRRAQAANALRHGALSGFQLPRPSCKPLRGQVVRAACAGGGAMSENTYDVAIVGGGPTGLSAATELKRMGVARVVILERSAEAGGIPRHCGHPPYGLREFARILTGPAYARRLVNTAKEAGVTILTKHTVVGTGPDGILTVASPDGILTLQATRILIATGAREATRAQLLVPGLRPSGVMNTAALQAFIYQEHRVPFRRPIIVGSELVSLSAILTCRSHGIRPVAMVESQPLPQARRSFFAMPHLLSVPLMTGTEILAIEGSPRVTSVHVRRHGGAETVLDCDGVIFPVVSWPRRRLPRRAGFALDRGTGGPAIDQHGRSSDPHIFAAGNVVHPIETAGHCWAEGRRVARAIAAELKAPAKRQRRRRTRA
jgi:glycine/D-amino acid oxidase-like deaminating enzyme